MGGRGGWGEISEIPDLDDSSTDFPDDAYITLVIFFLFFLSCRFTSTEARWPIREVGQNSSVTFYIASIVVMLQCTASPYLLNNKFNVRK